MVAALLVLPAALAWADVYSYTDRDGVVHFTNIKPRGGKLQSFLVVVVSRPGIRRALRRTMEPMSMEAVPRVQDAVTMATRPEILEKMLSHLVVHPLCAARKG